MASRWSQAATILPPTLKVCGKTLLPFCLRHRVALEAIGSPVLETEKEMTAEHMVAAVRILSSHDFKSLRDKPTWREMYWVSRLTFSKTALREEMAKLATYLNEQSLWPRFWVKDGNENKTSSFPWPLAVVASLTRNGCSLNESWTMPESEAVWLHIAHCSASGADVTIVTDKEWEAMEDYKRQTAAQHQTPNRN